MHFLSAVFCKTSSLRIYEYDDYGNMTSYMDYDGGTHTSTYDQYNRLKTIGEEEATYNDSTDKVSLNPSSINGMILTFTGRNLSTLVSDTAAIRFDYNEQGLRTYKINSRNQTFYEYFYDLDGKLIAENKVASTGAEDRINFLYHDNYLYGFTHNGTYYYYLRDSLGCINGIFDASGNLVVEYRYNAFGKILDITGSLKDTIGVYNPIRYKGYYYDSETGLFWLSSRYYSPELCRFIQPVDVSSLNPSNINGLNLYAYANNNPIGIAYRSSSAGFSTSGKMMSSLAISGSIILGYESSNKGFYWPNLDFLGTGFGYIENSFSMIAGVIDGVRIIKHLDKLAGLDKASNWLMGIGIGINVGLSLYNNLTNSNLSSAQKAGNIVGDIVYIAASSAATWGVSALTAMIPVVGPFLAPVVGFGFGIALDQFWHGEDIFGIEGISFNPGGKSIDEWIKEFLTELFGG